MVWKCSHKATKQLQKNVRPEYSLKKFTFHVLQNKEIFITTCGCVNDKILKGTYYAPFYKMYNKSIMSPERICEVLAQNTPQKVFYSLLKLALLECEPKRADFEYVALNANELLLPEKRAELQELKLRH